MTISEMIAHDRKKRKKPSSSSFSSKEKKQLAAKKLRKKEKRKIKKNQKENKVLATVKVKNAMASSKMSLAVNSKVNEMVDSKKKRATTTATTSNTKPNEKASAEERASEPMTTSTAPEQQNNVCANVLGTTFRERATVPTIHQREQRVSETEPPAEQVSPSLSPIEVHVESEREREHESILLRDGAKRPTESASDSVWDSRSTLPSLLQLLLQKKIFQREQFQGKVRHLEKEIQKISLLVAHEHKKKTIDKESPSIGSRIESKTMKDRCQESSECDKKLVDWLQGNKTAQANHSASPVSEQKSSDNDLNEFSDVGKALKRRKETVGKSPEPRCFPDLFPDNSDNKGPPSVSYREDSGKSESSDDSDDSSDSDFEPEPGLL